jgi:fructuronate reductase
MSTNSIVHLGIGNFFRAHQAVYTQQVGDDWQVIGVSLRRPAVRDQLRSHDYKYSVIEKSQDSESEITIDILKDILVAPESPLAVLNAMTADDCKIVSLTVTEKGYCVDPVTGELQLDHPDIAYDIQHLDTPKTAIGFIVSALHKRHELGLKPFTVMSCDNLNHNGQLLKNACLAFARKHNHELADWMVTNVAFPSTMVDRIVPASLPDDIAKAVIICEPFKQWVIGNKFCNDRPEWELAGAQLVEDVAPFEKMKLRLLNASHSALAYLGFLAGYDFIYEAVQDAQLREFVFNMMTDEIIPYLDMDEGVDLSAYRDELIHRFSNPVLPHRTYQVAMDGSQKLPQRIFPSILTCMQHKADYSHLLRVVVAWIRYTSGVDGKGLKFEVQDPLALHMAEIHHIAHDEVKELIMGYLALEGVFPDGLKTVTFASQLECQYLEHSLPSALAD